MRRADRVQSSPAGTPKQEPSKLRLSTAVVVGVVVAVIVGAIVALLRQ